MAANGADTQLARTIVSELEQKGIKLLALDFDKTIVTVHTYGFWKAGTPKLAEHVRPCFKALIQAALESSLCVCVVTYSTQPILIRDVLKMALPRCDTSEILIRANTKDFLTDQVTPPRATGEAALGKQQHIAWIVTELFNKKHAMVRPEEILLFDDQTENVQIAAEFGHQAYLVPEDIELVDIQHFVQSLVVTREPPATPTDNRTPLDGFAENAGAPQPQR